MSIRVDVWSDFVCPFCFAAACSLGELAQTHEIEVHWRSYELRPAGTTMPEWYKERIMASRPQLEQMIWENFGVQINPGPLGISSRQALIGAKIAETQGDAIGRAYHKTMLEAYWLEGQSIDDIEVIRSVAARAGMDPDAFAGQLALPEYDQAVALDIELAARIGIQGVPAQIFDKRYLISGFRPVDQLAQVVEDILQEGVSE